MVMFLLSAKIMRSIHQYRKKKPNNVYDNNASNRKQTQLCHANERKWKWKLLSHVQLFATLNSPGQNIGVGSLSLLQGIFSTQGLNSDLPHCRQTILPAKPHGKPMQMAEYKKLSEKLLNPELINILF